MSFEALLATDVAAYKNRVLENIDVKKNEIISRTADYLNQHSITCAILGISGGIDSSLVLAILCEVKRNHIPELKIKAVNIHFSVYDRVFDFKYIDMLKSEFANEVDFIDVDASKTLQTMFVSDMKLIVSPEIMAQSSYALRYQMLFTYAQIYKGITFGTTNRDEFEYSGWFGKSSDMVVDLQIISKLHKFEVIEMSKLLGVPDEIIYRTPVGDLLDNTSDEDNFGCTYDELSWYTAVYLKGWVPDEKLRAFLKEKFAKLEALHAKNAHKYQGQGFNPIFL